MTDRRTTEMRIERLLFLYCQYADG
eukprot:SAG25_NODE_9342_length_376_cov_2.162455_1_plen_24_part_10